MFETKFGNDVVDHVMHLQFFKEKMYCFILEEKGLASRCLSCATCKPSFETWWVIYKGDFFVDCIQVETGGRETPGILLYYDIVSSV